MKILITYPDIFLGIFLKERLKRSHRIIPGGFDCEDMDQTTKFLARVRPDAVILHVPFSGGIRLNTLHPADLMMKNVLIQTNVIKGAFENGVKQLYFIGSSCMYPKIFDRKLRTSDLMSGPLEDTNLAYANAKIAGWQMCKAVRQQSGFSYKTLIPANLYGEHDDFEENSAHVIGALVTRFHEAKIRGFREVTVWGTGRPIRDFLYAGDFADALAFLLQQRVPFDELNIGTGEGYSIRKIASMIRQAVGFKGRLVFDAKRPDGMKMKVLECRRIRQMGWRPGTSLEEGLMRTYRWRKKLPITS